METEEANRFIRARGALCRVGGDAGGIAARIATVQDADIVLRVRRPGAADIAGGAKQGSAVVAFMDPYGHIDA